MAGKRKSRSIITRRGIFLSPSQGVLNLLLDLYLRNLDRRRVLLDVDVRNANLDRIGRDVNARYVKRIGDRSDHGLLYFEITFFGLTAGGDRGGQNGQCQKLTHVTPPQIVSSRRKARRTADPCNFFAAFLSPRKLLSVVA